MKKLILFLFAAFAVNSSFGQIKISALPALSGVCDTCKFPVVKTGTTYKASGGQIAWGLSGTGGTTAGTNFLGTTDNVSLVFKTNNSERMRLLSTGEFLINTTTSPLSHKFVVYGSDITINDKTLGRGNGIATNTVFGDSVFSAGLNNNVHTVAIGYKALKLLNHPTTSGYNVAVGSTAMELATTSYFSVGVGYAALRNANTSQSNVGIGFSALRHDTTGSNNTAVGRDAGYGITTGGLNTALGCWAMGSGGSFGGSIGFTGSYNTALGGISLHYAKTASYNTAIGYSSMYVANSSIGYNTCVGYNSGSSLSTGNYNVILGSNTGASIAALDNHIILSDGAGNERARFDNNGYFGIGTTSPQRRLDVNGKSVFNDSLHASGAVRFSSGANNGYVWTSDANGNGTWQQPSIAISGTYTPTLTNVANLDGSAAYTFTYSRVGDVIHVFGEVDIDPTTTLTLTQLGISLPIASSIGNTYDIAGTSADDLGTVARIKGDTGNARAEVRLTPVDISNRRFSVHFSYRYVAP